MSDDKKTDVTTFSATDVDTAATLVAETDAQLDPEEGERIRKKIDRHIMPLMCGE